MVEVGANDSGEEDRILRYDGQATTKIGELDCADVDFVDQDPAGASVEKAEEG